ncbi:serine hydrolase domain-containing protein [Bryobacter aggregatus]|uniref:serine hydrolase domain-containing protein n=1 Tax=Bryobacter aggregatus TaxID=360054 RepID=UPI0004E23666|nr:serine hydrolase domain-containing protein [Bryobacter aggregatus]
MNSKLSPSSRREWLLLCGAASLSASGNPVAETFAKTQPFYGLVMLGKRGKMSYAKAFGAANIEEHKALSLTTPFAIGSISKWLSTTTVLKLVEQNKLSLDATILSYLPQYRADTGSKVTLRHLLCNASGIPNLFPSSGKADPAVLMRLTAQEALEQFCQGDLNAVPGTKFDYAITNWIIVYRILETVTGLPYEQAMRQLTLDPLQLSSTRADQSYADSPATAISYSRIQPPERRTAPRPSYLAASGGYYSTAADLMSAAHAIYDKGFLSPQSLRQFTHIEVESAAYALGGRVKTLQIQGKPHRFAWETGRVNGFRSVLAHRLDGEATVVILNNTDMSQKTLDEFAYSLLDATLP